MYSVEHAISLVLENKVKTRTDRLRKINKELDTYLYRASHDVRRPILTILGLVQIASLVPEKEREEIFDAIQKTATGMDKMLRKLQMAYALEKVGKRNIVPIDINKHIALEIEEIRHDYPAMQIQIVEIDHIVANSNIHLIDIILTNILENACMFSKSVNDHITITIRRENDYASILIKDQGIGIEEEYLEKIFEPYVRCSVKSAGSGLGLYLARKAAKRMGGSISVASVINHGAEFAITIPIETKINKKER